MKIVYSFAFMLLALSTIAQTKFGKYHWDSMPIPTQSETIAPKNGELVLLDRNIYEIYINSKQLFEELRVVHKKIKVDTHDAISRNNTIYIPLTHVIEIVDMAARFVSPDGKITVVAKENIKQIENLENKGDFKTFVIEGAEVGGQIEYFYVLRKDYTAYGSKILQDDTPIAVAEVVFATPEKLEYQFRYNNGFAPFEVDSTYKDMVVKRSISSNIKGIDEERYARYKPHMLGFDYSMAFNRFQSSIRQYSWSKVADIFYGNLYNLSKKEQKAAGNLLKKIQLTSLDNETNIRKIENWVKANIQVDENLGSTGNLVDNIKYAQCNHNDIAKLYVALFEAAKIPFELVKTGNEFEKPFQTDFNAYNYLLHSLFYFPKYEKFVCPEEPSYRMGIVPVKFQGANALFFSPIHYKNITTLGYKIGNIPLHQSYENTDSLFIDVKLDLDKKLLRTHTTRSMKGEYACNFQSVLHLMDDKTKSEFVESLFAMGKDHTEVLRLKYENSAPENIALKPLLWDLELESKALIVEAGEDYLVKIGETIGQQTELYQENKRELPVDVGFLHNYYRRITLAIPEGYEPANIDDLNMYVALVDGNKTGCFFRSVATFDGKILTIESDEQYPDANYGIEQWDAFRNVINAAADFNKKTVLLRQKQAVAKL
jgi:hypothetical protein